MIPEQQISKQGAAVIQSPHLRLSWDLQRAKRTNFLQMMTFNTCTSLTCPTPTSTKANPAAVSSPVLSRVHLQLVQVDGLQHLDLRLDAADKKTAQLVCAAESLRHFITG